MNIPLSDCSLGDILPLYAPLSSSPQQIPPSRISKTRSTSKKSPPPKVFVCSSPNCGKRFSKKWNLQAHERLHTGSTPFVCRLGCGEAYMWMSSRKGHELNRCKYALKKKKNQQKNQRTTAKNTRVQPTTTSGARKGEISAVIESSQRYEPPTLLLDNRLSTCTSTDSKDSLIVLDESSDCLSNATEDVLEKEESSCTEESKMLMDADLVLADVSLPETDIFTDHFFEWFLTRCGPSETQDS